jgi:hypothetical protein
MKLTLVCSYFVVLACVYAQPAENARRLLPSSSLRDKAWGAWYAGGSHDPALREMLLSRLRLAQSLRTATRDSEGYAYIQALFDALIQIPGSIPTDAILPFEDSWRPEILILLGRQPSAAANEAALLAMRGRSLPDPEWVAVNDLLFAGGSPGFLDRTLQELHHARVCRRGSIRRELRRQHRLRPDYSPFPEGFSANCALSILGVDDEAG